MKLCQNDMKLEDILEELESIYKDIFPEHLNPDSVKKYCDALCTLDKLVTDIKCNSFKNWDTEDVGELRSKLSDIIQNMDDSFGRMSRLPCHKKDKKEMFEKGNGFPQSLPESDKLEWDKLKPDELESYKCDLESCINQAKAVTTQGIDDILKKIDDLTEKQRILPENWILLQHLFYSVFERFISRLSGTACRGRTA